MISRVTAKNFLSWADLDFEIPTNVTMIQGFNEDDQTSEGSGKSSIPNALAWGIYGKLPKDTNIDDVIRSGSDGSCQVSVYFSDGLEIHRKRNPNELWMVRDGEEVRGKDARETQLLIEAEIGFSFNVFCQTIYLAQNYPKKFISASQEDKAKILSEVQNLEVFDKAKDQAHSLLKKEKSNLEALENKQVLQEKDIDMTKMSIQHEKEKFQAVKEARANEIASLEREIEHLQESKQSAIREHAQAVELLRQKVESEEKALEDAALSREKDKAQIVERIEELESEITELKNSVSDLSEQRAALELKDTKALEQERETKQEETNKLKVSIKVAEAEKQQQEKDTERGKRLGKRVKEIEAKIKELGDFIDNPDGATCPMCKTVLEHADTSHAVEEKKKLEAERLEVLEELKQVAESVARKIPDVSELQSRVAKNQEKLDLYDSVLEKEREKQNAALKLDQRIQSAKEQISTTQKTLEDRKLKLKDFEDNAHSVDTSKLDAAKDALKEKENAKPEFDEGKLEATRKKLDSVKDSEIDFDHTKLVNLESKLEELQLAVNSFTGLVSSAKIQIGRLETLKAGFKEVKAYVFASVLNELNSKVNQYMTQLFEVPAKITFTNDDMKINTVVDLDGQERGLGLLSGGQHRRVSLAIDFALSEIITSRKGKRVNLLILDEAMHNLSEASMEKVLRILQQTTTPTILIEHNTLFQSVVDNKFNVVLRNGVSEVSGDA